MTAPPDPRPADRDPDRPTPGARKSWPTRASKSWRTPRAPTSHLSPGEIAAHSASQTALSGSPWAASPTPTRPRRATDTTIISPPGPPALDEEALL